MNPVRPDDPAKRRRSSPDPDERAAAPGAARREDALLPGTRVEEFEIERVLATSGFGLVYLATDHAFERRVAIKEYFPDTLAVRGPDGVQVLLRAESHAEAFERGRRAFVEEAELLARLDHPSLLHVLRHWEGQGTVYRAMPYYPGTPLLRLREAMGTSPDEATLRALLDGLLEPLALLHAAGCIHREITPSSILLLPDDRPVLMDWGAARRAIVGDQARALMTLLAPSFAPLEVTAPTPERPQGPWTDLYALAAVVRYCISGQLPPPAALRTMPADEPIARMLGRLRRVNPSLHYSPSFVAAIDAALMPRPEDRPQDVAEMRALLDNHPAAFGERVEPVFDSGADGWGDGPREGPAPEPAPATAPSAAPPESAPSAASPAPEPAADAPPLRSAAAEAWMQTIIQVRPGDETPAPTGPRTPVMPPGEAPPTAAGPGAPAHEEARTTPAWPPTEPRTPHPRATDDDPWKPREPAFEDTPTEPLDARPSDFRGTPPDAAQAIRDRARSRRGRVAVTATALGLTALALGGWWLAQHRENADAQSAFARVARETGLPAAATAPTAPEAVAPASPAVPPSPAPRAADTPAVAKAPAPVVAPAPAPVVPPAPAPVAAPRTAPAVAAAPTPAPPPTAAATPAPAPAPVDPPVALTVAPRAVAAAPAPVRTAAAPPVEPPGAEPAEAEPADPASRRTAAAPRRSSDSAQPAGVSTSGTRAEAIARAALQPRTAASPQGPRAACGNRTQFSLYRCMQAQCENPRWFMHPSCKRLRLRDEVD